MRLCRDIIYFIMLSAGTIVLGSSEVLNEHGMLDQFTQVTKNKCVQICNDDIKCVWSSYNSMFKLCKIFGTIHVHMETKPAVFIYEKSSELLESDKTKLAECDANSNLDNTSETCKPKHCGEPEVHDDSEILGNMYRVGSKVRYDCADGTDSKISTCEPSGKWSEINISCRCSNPQINSNVGYILEKYNETHIRGQLSCPKGLALLFYKSSTPYCQISNGKWTGIQEENVCVNITAWLKIYEYSAGCKEFIINGWNEAGKHSCVYRHSKIDNWYNISQIKFDVIVNNASAAFIIFNGTGSDYHNWFSHQRVLESSWSALTPNSPVSVFSFRGANTFRRRWFVSKSHSSIKTGLCEADKVWVTVTWSGSHFTCIPNMPSEDDITVVLYSNSSEASSMKDMLLADSIRVSIKVEE